MKNPFIIYCGFALMAIIVISLRLIIGCGVGIINAVGLLLIIFAISILSAFLINMFFYTSDYPSIGDYFKSLQDRRYYHFLKVRKESQFYISKNVQWKTIIREHFLANEASVYDTLHNESKFKPDTNICNFIRAVLNDDELLDKYFLKEPITYAEFADVLQLLKENDPEYLDATDAEMKRLSRKLASCLIDGKSEWARSVLDEIYKMVSGPRVLAKGVEYRHMPQGRYLACLILGLRLSNISDDTKFSDKTINEILRELSRIHSSPFYHDPIKYMNSLKNEPLDEEMFQYEFFRGYFNEISKNV